MMLFTKSGSGECAKLAFSQLRENGKSSLSGPEKQGVVVWVTMGARCQNSRFWKLLKNRNAILCQGAVNK